MGVTTRPDWWPAWTDYPHGGLDESRARQLSGYCVNLERQLSDLRRDAKALVDAADICMVRRSPAIDLSRQVDALRMALKGQ